MIETKQQKETCATWHGGRPRDPKVDESIREAALQLLAEVGYEALTMEGIAHKAGVGKPTIYRRWSSKAELVIGTIRCYTDRTNDKDIDTGSVREDLIFLLQTTCARLSSPTTGRILAGLIVAMRRDPELAETYRSQLLNPRRQLVQNAIERGIARGELRPDIEPKTVIDLLSGPFFYRLLVTGESLNQQDAATMVDLVLSGILAASALSV